ncbi:MAG: succinate dehydrogenase cytochrome b subunit [Thermoanaerobaculia bacterium]
MTWFGNFYRSTIGKKAVMAVSGLILFGFVFVHMIGNLKMYLGAEHFNEYAHFLRNVGAPAVPENGVLWIARVVLLVMAGLHVWSAWQLTQLAWAARGTEKYRRRDFEAADYAVRTMRWGGVIVLLFIVFHILHLTTGQAHPSFNAENPYANVVAGFQVPWVAAIYIVANLALGLHLFHGVWSMFNSLGLNHERFNAWRTYFAATFALIITLGNVSFPLAVLTGIVR